MNTRETFRSLKKLFAEAPEEGKRTDGVSEYRTDHAKGLSLRDIEKSKASEELKTLLKTGFMKAGGEMTVIIIHHGAQLDRDERFIFEMAGQPQYSPRIGAQLVIDQSLEGHVTHMKMSPSLKMLGVVEEALTSGGLFKRMLDRSEDVTAHDAVEMIRLGKKAIVLPQRSNAHLR